MSERSAEAQEVTSEDRTAEAEEPKPEDRAAEALAEAARILEDASPEPPTKKEGEEPSEVEIKNEARRQALRLFAREIKDIRGRLRAETY